VELILWRGSLHAVRELFPEAVSSKEDGNPARPDFTTRLQVGGNNRAGQPTSSSGWWGMELRVLVAAAQGGVTSAAPPGVYAVDLVRGLPSASTCQSSPSTTWISCQRSPSISVTAGLSNPGSLPQSCPRSLKNQAPRPEVASATIMDSQDSILARGVVILLSVAASLWLLYHAAHATWAPARQSPSFDFRAESRHDSSFRPLWWRSPPQPYLVATVPASVCSDAPLGTQASSAPQPREQCPPGALSLLYTDSRFFGKGKCVSPAAWHACIGARANASHARCMVSSATGAVGCGGRREDDDKFTLQSSGGPGGGAAGGAGSGREGADGDGGGAARCDVRGRGGWWWRIWCFLRRMGGGGPSTINDPFECWDAVFLDYGNRASERSRNIAGRRASNATRTGSSAGNPPPPPPPPPPREGSLRAAPCQAVLRHFHEWKVLVEVEGTQDYSPSTHTGSARGGESCEQTGRPGPVGAYLDEAEPYWGLTAEQIAGLKLTESHLSSRQPCSWPGLIRGDEAGGAGPGAQSGLEGEKPKGRPGVPLDSHDCSLAADAAQVGHDTGSILGAAGGYVWRRGRGGGRWKWRRKWWWGGDEYRDPNAVGSNQWHAENTDGDDCACSAVCGGGAEEEERKFRCSAGMKCQL
jgi:hypothetical protein